MAVSKNGGKSKGMSRFARDRVNPVNGGNRSKLGAGASRGSGNKGSTSQLTRQASKGSGTGKRMAGKLNSGTSRTGAQPRGPFKRLLRNSGSKMAGRF